MIRSIVVPMLLLSSILISCGGSGDEPCDWYQSPFYAKVERYEFDKLNAEGDSVFIVWVDFSSGSLNKELQDLGKLRDVEFTREKIKANQAFLGNSFTGIISDVKSGNCTSPLVSFDQKLR